MDNNNETRQEWVAPEIIDLDIENTASGAVHPSELGSTGGPLS